jgi:hypothetical protein
MVKVIRQMLSDDSGQVSTTRVVTIGTAVIVLGVYVAVNVMSMLKQCCGMIDFPTNTVYVLLVVMGAKVGQSAFENKNPPVPPA